MRTQTVIQWLSIGIAVFCLAILFRGCKTKQTFDATKLPGVWRSSEKLGDTILTFETNGSLRWQIEYQTGWLGLLNGTFDVAGHWKLTGNRLTIELTDTPPLIEFWGENWKGRSTTTQIERLTNEELLFADSDLKFCRRLDPFGK